MHSVCDLDDIVPNTGVCALVGGRQVAIFRLDDDSVHALDNYDPFSKANVLARGIVGDLKGELVVASPVYKQHFSLLTGRCIEHPSVEVPVYRAITEGRRIFVQAAQPEIATTCCYCGVGCGVLVKTRGEVIVDVRGDPGHPANFGRLCAKGLALHKAHPGFRALYPEIRGERKSWDEALGFLAERFRQTIADHGPDAVAFYVSGQLLTEDYYVFNKLAKGLIGTNNIDTNSRLCMASAVAGYKQTLGADAPPTCYEDIDHAECLFIAGSNTAWAHPVLFRRIEKAAPKSVVVVDPRRTETARAATLHLQIAPGTDVALFNGMLHVMLLEGWIDERYVGKHTENFAEVRSVVKAASPAAVAQMCGIAARDLYEAARQFATARATLSLYCQGLNQSSSGTAKNAALINLHLASGQIGRAGAGPFSLTGQPNAMGGREVGGMAGLLPGHREVSSERDRDEIAAFWGVQSLPARPGKTAVELFEALRTGEIKAVWIACTNPAHSLPDQRRVRESLERAELVVVQDAYRDTETAAFAHVFLPAAGWGEKEGTVTNSERRISRVRAAAAAPGEARADWEIAVDFARRLSPKGEKLFPFRHPEAIFREHRETTRGRDLDITGLSYALLDARGPQQWPFPERAHEGKKRLYEDGIFATRSGRARFVATSYRPVAEAADAAFPLRLTTGRMRDHWHTMSRTGTVAKLFAHEPEPRLSAHPDDLQAAGVSEGELVRVVSRRGAVTLHAAADTGLPRGTVFLPMHWGHRFLGQPVNELTLGALDPTSKQPELKHCAVRLDCAALPWRLVAFGDAPDVHALWRALDFAMSAAPYAARTLIGRDRAGVRLVLAASEPLLDEIVRGIDTAYGLRSAGTIRYEDARAIALERDRVRALRLSGDLRAEAWLRELWERGAPAGPLLPYLSLPAEAMPQADTPRGRTLCNCFDVAEREVQAYVARSSSLAALQSDLKCGTGCGTCLPELERRFSSRSTLFA